MFWKVDNDGEKVSDSRQIEDICTGIVLLIK